LHKSSLCPSRCVLPDEKEAAKAAKAASGAQAPEVLVRDAQRCQGSGAPPEEAVQKTRPRGNTRAKGETRDPEGAPKAREHCLSLQRAVPTSAGQEKGKGTAYPATTTAPQGAADQHAQEDAGILAATESDPDSPEQAAGGVYRCGEAEGEASSSGGSERGKAAGAVEQQAQGAFAPAEYCSGQRARGLERVE